MFLEKKMFLLPVQEKGIILTLNMFKIEAKKKFFFFQKWPQKEFGQR